MKNKEKSKSTKEVVKNKYFTSVRDKLKFIHNHCKEPELFEDLRQLFIKKSFKNVKITHGPFEYGKDLVFSSINPIYDEEQYFAVIVKNKDSHLNDFVSGGDIANQVNLAFTKALKTTKGEEKNIAGLFIIINGSISFQAKDVMKGFAQPGWIEHTVIWDYQDLSREIENNIKDIFLQKIEPIIHIYSKAQFTRLSDLSNTKNLLNMDIKEIDDIFVNVETTYTKQQRQMRNYVSFEGATVKEKGVETFDDAKEVLQSVKNFVIHGIPTSGKSLLLRRIGIKALEEKSKKPNAVFYFEMNREISTETEKIDISKLIKKQYTTLTQGEEFIRDDFNKVYVLFDGLDELPTDDVKVVAFKAIEEFAESEELNVKQIVVACRNTEILDNENILLEFEKTGLLPFDAGQAFQLVKKIIPNDKEKSKAFLNAMKSSLLDSGLLRTPFSLSLLAILYRDDEVDLNELPANITELYNKFVDAYLDRWDANKGITNQFKYDQTKLVLAFLALHMQENEMDEISEADVLNYLDKLKRRYNYNVLQNVKEFVNHLKYKNGVFNYNDISNSFYYYNHYFQEYFVSICIDDSNEEILLDKFLSEWWQNAIVFYCGKQPKRDKFILETSKIVIPSSLRDKFIYLQLLSKCLQANHSISISSRLKILDRMLAVFNKMYNEYIELGKAGQLPIAHFSTTKIIVEFREIFEKLFESKHIFDDSCKDKFETLLSKHTKDLSDVAKYCIAYFLALRDDSPIALEYFISEEGLEVFWNRIIVVDIEFMRYKKSANPELFKRVRRKMNKRKFEILEQLNGSSITYLGQVNKEDSKA